MPYAAGATQPGDAWERGKRNRARADGMHAREMDTLYEEAEAEASASHFTYAQPQYEGYANGMVLVFFLREIFTGFY